LTATALALAVAPAQGAVTIGEAAAPTGSNSCAPGGTGATYVTIVSAAPPAPQYSAPSDGVITSWSFHTGAATPTSLKMKVARPSGGATRTMIGESELRAVLPSRVNSFATRIPVQTGDEIGMFATSSGAFQCIIDGASYTSDGSSGDMAVGSSRMFFGNISAQRLSLEALLEPDADADGYGDESQDACPGDAAVHSAPCPDRVAPNTFITEHPPRRTTTKKATFEFASSEDGSTFECSLDGGVFVACASPHQVRVKRGKHTFAVRATDAAGNADASPDGAVWKFKKRK
jgi:hypothetical protein